MQSTVDRGFRGGDGLYDKGKCVRGKRKGVEGRADCGRIRRKKSKNERLSGAGRREGGRLMASGGGSGIQMDSQRKEQK